MTDGLTRDLGEFYEERLRYYENYKPGIRVGRESLECPKEVSRLLRRAGGTNPYGEPMFRVVWGWSRLTLIGGEWTDWDEHTGALIRTAVEYRWEPKYLPFDRYHIEKWMPAEFFGSPEDWFDMTAEVVGARTIPALGPYPSRGEYEHVKTIEGPDGEFLPLVPHVVEQIVQSVERCRYMRHADRRQALERREAKKEKDWDSLADDILDDASPAFCGQPQIRVPAIQEVV